MDEMDPRAAEAEAYLRANGVEGVTIKGSGEDWFVSIGFGVHERFVTAYSAKNPATPTDPMYLAEQALAALIRNERPSKPAPVVLTTEATLEPLAAEVLTDEVHAPEHPESEQTGEAAEPIESAVGGGTDASAAEDTGSTEDGPASGGGALQPYDGQDGAGDSDTEYAFDADYEEAGEDLGAELLDDFASAEPALLDAPDPEDFAPEDFAPEPEAPQDRFIGLDDLDRVRSLRIGDVATEALRLTTLIEHAVSEQEGEFSNIQAYVVSNLDKHTGAFTPQDDASRTTYGRFLELSSARSKIAMIDARRKDATAFLIAAGRDEVVGFDVMAAFL